MWMFLSCRTQAFHFRTKLLIPLWVCWFAFLSIWCWEGLWILSVWINMLLMKVLEHMCVCVCDLLWCCSNHLLIALKDSQGIGICPLNWLFVKEVTIAKHLLLRNYCEGMSSGWTSYRLLPATKGYSWVPESVLANMTKIMESCQLQPSPTAYHWQWLIHLFLMSCVKLVFSSSLFLDCIYKPKLHWLSALMHEWLKKVLFVIWSNEKQWSHWNYLGISCRSMYSSPFKVHECNCNCGFVQ